MLTPDEFQRYARQVSMKNVGVPGQEKLKNASVLIVGVGGLGSPVALYLTAAGVGRIGLVDFDRVDVSNLQRQVLFSTQDVGKLKVECAKEKLNALNPLVTVSTYPTQLQNENAEEIFGDFDVIVDGTDNFEARDAINTACVHLRKTWVFGSVFQSEGLLSVFNSDRGPCYRCLYPTPTPATLAPNCMETGVLGVTPALIGVMQAKEVLKFFLEDGNFENAIDCVDAFSGEVKKIKTTKNKNCPVCSEVSRN